MSHSHRGGEARRQYQVVADRIRALIDNEGRQPGSRLPPERELAVQLGVSRPSLREALIALEIDGRVEIRGGSGVYVCAATNPADGETPSLGDSPAELMDARVVLESAIMTLAAARVTQPGLQRVADALAAMHAEVAQGRSPVDADRRFHAGVAEMTGNPVLVSLVTALFDGRHSPISSRMRQGAESAGAWQAALAEHEAILMALEARDPYAATAAMCAHLQASFGRWMGARADVASRHSSVT
ncbi:FadR/GntR family transcriptional regulator [Pelomonas cellulosilytica]|uniref:FadR family transcriptional regulator n=1 Tax=Pelomonas cellulosilytica TaxID=2906762 RepID=A0ABS8XZ37_9BURK|nr:FadR/GntR family transcriptional regulator [Pelomonas sp. P8]MCE4557891.1 FadR family transcriptional regulator [Pelomonas sp. P8]